MSDDDFRRMSDSQLIDMTLAALHGGSERMRYARAQTELTRREGGQKSGRRAGQLQTAGAQAGAATAAAQSSRDAARAIWGLVYLAIIMVLVGAAGLGWQIFSAFHG